METLEQNIENIGQMEKIDFIPVIGAITYTRRLYQQTKSIEREKITLTEEQTKKFIVRTRRYALYQSTITAGITISLSSAMMYF